jgi:hypothetical protein
MTFDTKLDAENEKRFNFWLSDQSTIRKRDLSKDLEDYDLRGYWFNGGYQDRTGKGHMPDTYKKPNHPTFSNESIYNGVDLGNGQIAQGGKWGEGDSFEVGPTNMQFYTPEQLKSYFQKVEPKSKLIIK